MKKLLFLAVLVLCQNITMHAQKIVMKGDGEYGSIRAIPCGFTTDSKTKIHVTSGGSGSELSEMTINVYDDSFNAISVIKPKFETYISYETKVREWNESDGKYNGDWVTTDYYEGTIYAKGLILVDLSSTNPYSHPENYKVHLTQTLFNTDEKYEYAYPRYTIVEDKKEEDRDRDGDIDYVSINRDIIYEGMDILSDDGSIVTSYSFSEKAKESKAYSYIYGYILEGKKYLAFHMEDWEKDEFWYEIFPIESNSSQVTRVSDNNAIMHILPAMPRKNTSVTVEFDEESVKNGGELMITDMNGRMVYRDAVAPGEVSVRVPLRRMASGMYNLTLTCENKLVESTKLIVR